ncbi:MAG: tetratricopeptide repeat protein [Spirochaetota bacterium]
MKYIKNLSKFLVLLLVLCQCGENEALKKRYKQAILLFRNRKNDLALKSFRKINKTQPGYKQTNLFLGKIYYYKQEYTKALDAFRIYSKYHPDSSLGLLWVIKAEYLLREMKPEDLLALIDSYLSQENKNPEMLFMYAKTLQRANKSGQAIAYYKQVLHTILFMQKSSQELAKIYGDADFPQTAQTYRNFSQMVDKQIKLLAATNNGNEVGQK